MNIQIGYQNRYMYFTCITISITAPAPAACAPPVYQFINPLILPVNMAILIPNKIANFFFYITENQFSIWYLCKKKGMYLPWHDIDKRFACKL